MASSHVGCPGIEPERGRDYSAGFYDGIRAESLESARVVVPLVIQVLKPRRVIDLGCGTGTWLAVFKEHGVEQTRGVDGPWVDRSNLEIPASEFAVVDFEGPLDLQGEFDLSMSLEVAEHLSPMAGDGLVAALTDLAPMVLFSAAIPHQGGTRHVNEQWPLYWVERFRMHGFVVVDCLRRSLWQEERVASYYAQNVLLFVERNRLEQLPGLRHAHDMYAGQALAAVHPAPYLALVQRCQRQEARIAELEQYCQQLLVAAPGAASLRAVLGSLPALAVHALRRRLRRRGDAA